MAISIQLFIVLIVCGILLIGAEVFVPGGVLGMIGGFMLVCSVLIAFNVFGAQIGFIMMVALIIFVVLFICLWLRFVPKTSFGRALTLSSDGAAFKVADDKNDALLNKRGITLSELRPSGMARIENKRYDVTTDGVFIAKDQPVNVVGIQDNQIVVAPVAESERTN